MGFGELGKPGETLRMPIAPEPIVAEDLGMKTADVLEGAAPRFLSPVGEPEHALKRAA